MSEFTVANNVLYQFSCLQLSAGGPLKMIIIIIIIIVMIILHFS